MRRKPSASHWVKKLPLETYSPLSSVLSLGAMRVSIDSSQASGMSGNDQRAVLDVVLVVAERLAIARQAQQRERLAVQPQRRIGWRRGIAAQLEHRGDARRGFVEIEVQFDVIDQEWRWLIVGEADHARGRLGRDIAGIVEHCRHLWFAGSLPPDATTADASSPGQAAWMASTKAARGASDADTTTVSIGRLRCHAAERPGRPHARGQTAARRYRPHSRVALQPSGLWV